MFKPYRKIGAAAALLVLSLMGGVACGSGPGAATEPHSRETGAAQVTEAHTMSIQPFDLGAPPLEQLVIRADIIAVVKLIAVERGLEARKIKNRLVYAQTLEFYFEVEQYLKGKGEDYVVGLVFDWDEEYSTAEAAARASAPLPDRVKAWDDRRAVVFLSDQDTKEDDITWPAGRYYLGLTFGDEDHFSVAGGKNMPWMPAVSNSADEKTFLLESDLKSPDPETFRLDDLKGQISQLEQLLAGRSDEYVECVVLTYQWHTITRNLKEQEVPAYQYRREDASIQSGSPWGTYVFTDSMAGHYAKASQSNAGPEGSYVLAGHHPEYFIGKAPGHIFTMRPLPAGVYRFNHAYLPYSISMCGGTIPLEEMGSRELFVTVTAPEGTLYEAFFDPGDSLAADFREGPVERISWEDGRVFGSLRQGNKASRIEFINLDGTVRISLGVNKLKEEKEVLSWTVKSQPWQAGDRLMMRVYG